MNKRLGLTLIVIILASAGLIIFYKATSASNRKELNFTKATKGTFEIVVSNTGELVPERSMDIRGPDIVRNRYFRVAPLKITDLIPEGTILSRGDYVATLDRTSFDNTLKDETTTLNTLQSDYDMKLLDTAVVLSTLRDDIKNQIYAVEEASIVVDESKYEPPATQRHAEIELDMANRVLEQKRRLYSLNLAQTSLETRKLKLTLSEQDEKVKDLQNILASFTVTSPSDGMISYKKDRMGVKIRTGAMLNPFDPVIATLPDLSSLDSKTYVSEIDINKIKAGQPVEVGIDALRGKTFMGKVSGIANIGEQLANSDSKVFEVQIRLDESDPALRPSMTSSNKIVISTFYNVVSVPMETVQAGPDSIPFVYTKNGMKQVVLLGKSNDKNIIVEKGLEAGTEVYLSTPDKFGKFTLSGTGLIPVIKERNKARMAEYKRSMKEPKVIAGTGKSPSE